MGGAGDSGGSPSGHERPDGLSVERKGDGPPVVFVHGSVVGATTWRKQRPLAKRWTTMVLERRGFGRSPHSERDDFDVDARDIAAALEDGAHLVAHSYGGLGALLAATERPGAVRSLTLVEPVAYSLALDDPAVQRAILEMIEYFTSAPDEPRAFLKGFMPLVGLDMNLPGELPAALKATTQLLIRSKPPFAARIRIEELARAGIPTLVVSARHSDAFEAICDRLAEGLGAERAVIPGATHAIPSAGAPFNDVLERFLSRSDRLSRAACSDDGA